MEEKDDSSENEVGEEESEESETEEFAIFKNR